MKVLMPVGGFPTAENPQSGIFSETAAKLIGQHVDLTVLHFRYWKPGRKLLTSTTKRNYNYISVSIPTIPFLHHNWSAIHFYLYKVWFNLFLKKKLKNYDLVHCVQGEVGVWFSQIKEKHSWKLTTQFIGTDLTSELFLYRNKRSIHGWEEKLDGASFNSHSLKNLFDGYYPNFNKPSQVIYRGVNKNEFSPEINLNPNEFNFLFLGGLANYKNEFGRNMKGGIDLLRAWKLFKNKHPNPNVRLYFGGADTNSNQVSRLNLPVSGLEGIFFMGPLSKKDVLKMYHQTNCTIIPSRKEGFPNVSLESQSCGNPIIGSKILGIEESVINNKTATLYEVGDIEELSNLLHDFSSNNSKVHTLGINARNHIVTNFDNEHFGKKYKVFFDLVYSNIT